MKAKKTTFLFVLAASLLLSACNIVKPSVSGDTSEIITSGTGSDVSGDTDTSDTKTSTPVAEEGDILITTDLTETKEIHTAQQKEYLSYKGDYSKIDPNLYPNGDSKISDPLPVKLEWVFTPEEGKQVKNITIKYGLKEDLTDAYTVTSGAAAKSASLTNVFLGTNYFEVKANYSDNTFATSGVKTFKVDETAPRNIAVDGLSNIRDMGGRKLIDGGTIKQGLVYRTCGNDNQSGNIITDSGKSTVQNQLKWKTEVNVSDGNGYNFNMSGQTVKNLNMDYDTSRQGLDSSHHLSRNTESVKNFFNLLADTNTYPLYYHCRIGTDRTGLCAILLNGLLGVEMNEIYQDYLFSNFGKIGEKRYIGSKAGQDNIENYIAEINKIDGAKFQNKVYNFLTAIGVTPETLNKVISNLTEGETVKGNDAGQIVVTADKLTLEGGATLQKDSSDRNNPNNYVTLNSASKAVSYKFTAKTAFKGQVVAYLGNTSHDKSAKIATAVGYDVNGVEQTVTDMTFATAGMGKCGNRMNYYPVILGTVDFIEGENTVKITGKANKTMNIGTLCVFGAGNGATSDPGDEQPGGQQGEEPAHTEHSWVIGDKANNSALRPMTCSCKATGYELQAADLTSGHKNPSISDSKTRLGKDNVFDDVWNITGIEAGKYALYLNAQASSGNATAGYWNSEKGGGGTNNGNSTDWKYKLKIDANDYINIGDYNDNYADTGLSDSQALWTNKGLCEVTIASGAQTLTIHNMNNGYSIWVFAARLVKIA